MYRLKQKKCGMLKEMDPDNSNKSDDKDVFGQAKIVQVLTNEDINIFR